MKDQAGEVPRDLKELASRMSLSLLAWWEVHGRRDPLQKPWMFMPKRRWPQPDQWLSPYGVWIAEVMLYSATYMVSLVFSGGQLHGVGLFLSAGFHWRSGQ